METIDNQRLTVTVKIMLIVIASTATVVFTVLSTAYEIKSEFHNSIKNLENENRIQDLKYENLRLEVERNKLSIEKLKDEYKRDQ